MRRRRKFRSQRVDLTQKNWIYAGFLSRFVPPFPALPALPALAAHGKVSPSRRRKNRAPKSGFAMPCVPRVPVKRYRQCAAFFLSLLWITWTRRRRARFAFPYWRGHARVCIRRSRNPSPSPVSILFFAPPVWAEQELGLSAWQRWKRDLIVRPWPSPRRTRRFAPLRRI